MANEDVLIFISLLLISLTFSVQAAPGTATFNTIYLPSSCYGYQALGTMIAAANPSLFNNGAACGSSYKVKCTGGTSQGVPHPCTGNEVIVTIVDLCSECGPDQFDLSQEAFSVIADLNEGKIITDYVQV